MSSVTVESPKPSSQLTSPLSPPQSMNTTTHHYNNNKPSSRGSHHNNKPVARSSIEYLQELLKDKKMLMYVPNIFHHVQRLLDAEINRVRSEAFHNTEHFKINNDDLPLPEGPTVTKQEKVFVPVKDHPNYNFVGRLLGPAGMTAKQLEKDLGCKIMIRGKGSMRDKKKEEMQRGKPSWEHLDEDLHVLVSVEDAENRAEIRAQRAAESIREFFNEAMRTPENQDKLKQIQLMELQLMTYKNAMNVSNAGWFNTNPWLQTALLTAQGNPPAAYMRPPAGAHLYSSAPGQHSMNGRNVNGTGHHPGGHGGHLHQNHQTQQMAAAFFNGDLATAALLNGYQSQILPPGAELLLAGNPTLAANGFLDYGSALAASFDSSSGASNLLRHPGTNFALTPFPVSAAPVVAPVNASAGMSLIHPRRESP